jgi:hypothetical protein
VITDLQCVWTPHHHRSIVCVADRLGCVLGPGRLAFGRSLCEVMDYSFASDHCGNMLNAIMHRLG